MIGSVDCGKAGQEVEEKMRTKRNVGGRKRSARIRSQVQGGEGGEEEDEEGGYEEGSGHGEEVAEGDGSHSGEPEGVEERDMFEELGAFAANREVDGAEA